MKKTLLFFTFSLFLFSFCFAGEFGETDLSIYNEVVSAFDTGFYPGAVEKAKVLEQEYPDSVFVLPALVQKGEALVYLNRYQEATETLEDALKRMHTGSENFARCYYLLGKASYLLGNTDYALQNFYSACNVSLSDGTTEFYAPSVLYAARIYYSQPDYAKAIPLFEYIVQNGGLYVQIEYEEAVQKLFRSYNSTQQPQKTINLYEQISENSVSKDVYWNLSLSTATAYELKNENKSASELYTQVISKAPTHYAVEALKKLYIITQKTQGNVDGTEFAKLIAAVSGDPELENEFWLRLGVDEYNQNNIERALEFFQKASTNGAVIFYQQKIALEKKQNTESVEKNLTENKEVILNSNFENISDSYYSLLLRCKILQKKWDEAIEIYSSIQVPVLSAQYDYATALFNKKSYALLNESFNQLIQTELPAEQNAALFQLCALSLACEGKTVDSAKLYKILNEANFLTNESKLEYSKVLFRNGSYKSALKMAKESGLPQGLYICGLCSNNLKDWNGASAYFAEYIKAQSNKNDFNKLSLFYKGYSEYCLEQYKDACSSFARFTLEAPKNLKRYIRSAYEYAAKSALQQGDFKNAITQAQGLLDSSVTTEEKHEALIFCSDIYSDNANYDKAIAVLSPYTNETGDFAITCLFQIAKIYVKQGKISLADQAYTRIYTENPKSGFAEEAMYRSGEIYYSSEDYANAQSRLNKYIYKYVNGKYSEAALFYCADSFLRLGEYSQSIMLNKTLVQKYKESVYLYGVYINLLTAYTETESYSEALEAARFLVKNYPTQAATDGIGTKLKELEKITGGQDPQIAKLSSEYDKLGKNTTAQGRATGTKLVQLYAAAPESKYDAYLLASEIFPSQKAEEEKYEAALNAEVIADYYRSQNQNKEAAEMYLTAAEYYRSSSQGEKKAPVVLYGAVEAFSAQGLTADAKQTAELLVKLYPESKQAKNVRRLMSSF